MKLLYVLNNNQYFLSHRLHLAAEAKEKGFIVHVACPRDENVDAIIKHGFSYHEIPLSRKGGNPFKELKSILALYHLYKNLQPDLIHHLTIKPVIYGGLAARLLPHPIVNTIPGLGAVFIGKSIKLKLFKAFVRLLYPLSLNQKSSLTIFQNNDDLNLFIKNRLIKDSKTALIKSSGVVMKDFPFLPEVPNCKLRVVLPARMLWHKGIREFVEAAKILKQREINVSMILVGGTDTGNPAAISEQQLLEWQQANIIDWCGHRNNMAEIFAKSHIICLPSYREGFPKVLLEAAACGRVVITTNVPGCKEAITHNQTGLVVPVKDVDALVNAIEFLSKNEEKRKEMAENAYERVKKEFAIERINEQTLAIYNSLLLLRLADKA